MTIERAPHKVSPFSENAGFFIENVTWKMVRIISYHCPVTRPISRETIEHVIRELFPYIKYTKLPEVKDGFLDLITVRREFSRMNSNQKVSEMAIMALMRFLEGIVVYICDIARQDAKCVVSSGHIRQVLQTSALFDDILPFLYDPLM